MWRKFDDFMQNWYMSMPDPLRDVVIGTIALVVGGLALWGFLLCMR